MANIVEQIYDAIKSEVATSLGASYQELPFVFDVSKNDLRRIKKGYGVLHKSATSADSVTRVYALDHSFQVIFTETNGRTNSDADAQEALNVLYDKIDEIFKGMVLRKLGLNSIVLLVFEPSIEEPEFLDDNQFLVLRFGFIVKYRQTIT